MSVKTKVPMSKSCSV